jgi:hypothetical protein
MKVTSVEVVGLHSTKVNQKISKAGYEYTFHASTWRLDKDNSISLGWIMSLDISIQQSARKTLSYYAENLSAAHTNFISNYMQHMITALGCKKITTDVLINYRSTLDENHQYYLGTIKGYLLQWNRLGFTGVDNSVVDLLKNWRIKGNSKGQAVLSLDPEKGPFSDIEFEAMQEQLPVGFATNLFSVNDYAITTIVLNTGRRPRQIGDLKVCDLIKAKSQKGVECYFIDIPRAKQRGGKWRGSSKRFALTYDSWHILTKHTDVVVNQLEDFCGRELTPNEIKQLPLFPRKDNFGKNINQQRFIELLETDYYHRTTASITDIVIATVKQLHITSERTGKQLKVNSRRFRYTLGTRTAREGYGELIIAEMLDQSDTQNAGVYVKNIPDFANKISDIMNAIMLPYAQAFAGTIVKSELEAIRGEDFTSRVRKENDSVGTCGSFGFCSALAPIACYTCNKFQPWQEAPHKSILEWLVEERERILEVTGDKTMAAINDRSIIAVTQVILLCDQQSKGLK